MSDNNLEKLLPWNEEVFELCKIEKQMKEKITQHNKKNTVYAKFF